MKLMDLLHEGVDDPGILKAVFMAGGPGSGKSFVAASIFGIGNIMPSTAPSGLKVMNSDTLFVKFLKRDGVDPRQLASIADRSPEEFDRLLAKNRDKAKGLLAKLRTGFERGRLGLLIDGTGRHAEKIKSQKDALEKMGYDAFLVFVNTSKEVALERNRNRDRVLPEKLVIDAWDATQQNLGKFQSMFGSSNMRIVDNSKPVPPAREVTSAVNSFVSKPISNPIGRLWITVHRMVKNTSKI